MYCYDCVQRGDLNQAVAVCAACGAGVCADSAREGRQTIRLTEGFVSAGVANVETRVINCPLCADALHVHHRVEKGLVRS
ncbi:MAG: hypothetical protein QOI78_4644, partial [Actinomycetota bacterium]|nr:hypothetical protein [Actinomycetota bacterium]